MQKCASISSRNLPLERILLGEQAYGVTGIPGYLTINNYGLYTILLLISGGIAFGLTMAIWKEEADEEGAAPAAAVAKLNPQTVQNPASSAICAPHLGHVFIINPSSVLS